MWFLMLILGFAIAVLVMPPTTVEQTQRAVRRTIADLAKKIQDNDDKNKSNDEKEDV